MLRRLCSGAHADPCAPAHAADNFFKERSWLKNEFPELADCLKADVRIAHSLTDSPASKTSSHTQPRPQAGPRCVVEIGCGNGSTLFPLLADNENPLLDLHGYDYSKEAVAVVKVRP